MSLIKLTGGVGLDADSIKLYLFLKSRDPYCFETLQGCLLNRELPLHLKLFFLPRGSEILSIVNRKINAELESCKKEPWVV